MNPITLHIVSFDIPLPANYGGVIDVFYKIRALHAAGVCIHLHCFQHRRGTAAELDQYCESVRYYARRTGPGSHLSLLPYIVKSRISEPLVQDLLLDEHPILFEGLHTCGILDDPRLKGRFMVYRESNIEHHYYYHLAKAEKSLPGKLYFLTESARLKRFQSILRHASLMLTVSKEDTAYLARVFPENRVVYLPSFHPHETVSILPGKGTYALYQGKLSVPENSKAAEYLIGRVWDDTLPELVIAGLDPPSWLTAMVLRHPNIRLVANPTDGEMNRLIREAHVNLMVTSQPTGLKLKLLNALFNGRFCLVNPFMVTGTSLGELCAIAETAPEFRKKLLELFHDSFGENLISWRESLLLREYSNLNNCNLLVNLLTLC